MVGVAGFEPATSCSQGTRANQAALHPDPPSYNSRGVKVQGIFRRRSNGKSPDEFVVQRIVESRAVRLARS